MRRYNCLETTRHCTVCMCQGLGGVGERVGLQGQHRCCAQPVPVSPSRYTAGHGWAPQSGCWHLLGNVFKEKAKCCLVKWGKRLWQTGLQAPRSVKEEGKEVLQVPEQGLHCSSWKATTEGLAFSCSLWRGPHQSRYSHCSLWRTPCRSRWIFLREVQPMERIRATCMNALRWFHATDVDGKQELFSVAEGKCYLVMNFPCWDFICTEIPLCCVLAS